MTEMDAEVARIFLDFSRNKLLKQYWPRLRAAVEPLSDEQVWWRPNDASNSIGNLVLHLNGNVFQWLVASFKRLPDGRNRPVEFSEREGIPAAELLQRLDATMQQAAQVLDRLTQADLVTPCEIQGYHVMEHFGLHYGQILYIVKTLSGQDLGFYSELNKTGRRD